MGSDHRPDSIPIKTLIANSSHTPILSNTGTLNTPESRMRWTKIWMKKFIKTRKMF